MFTDEHLQAFDSAIRQLGVSAFLCGGTVRDLLLNRAPRDVDVVISGRVREAASLMASQLNLPHFVMDEERQVVRVVCEPGNWDFTGFRNHSIEGDLRKRDFTINAMAIRWADFFPGRNSQSVIDPFGGMGDLQRRLIRQVAEESLKDDPLRMLRAFRIRAELNFAVDPSVLTGIEQLHPLISGVATERVTEEIDRIFLQTDSAAAWRALGETPLLDSLFPEMKPMKGCEQGGHHHVDVWSHSVLALENLERLVQELSSQFPPYDSSLVEYLQGAPGTLDRKRLLKWATLLHDIGKPQTRELREPGRWRFHGHDHVGVDLADALLKRLKFARKDSLLVCSFIEHHLRPLNLFQMPDRNKDQYHRFFRATAIEGPGVLLLSWSDMTAARGPLADPARVPAFRNMLLEMLAYCYKEYFPAINTPELLRGRDLMAVLQMKPGPLMGELLHQVREAQLAGAVQNRQEALDYARKWLKEGSTTETRRTRRIEDRG